MDNENKQSLEDIFNELLEQGMNRYEVEEHINSIILYRYLDSVSPSEQIIRHSSYLDNKINSGVFDLDMEETYQRRYGHMFEQEAKEAAEAELIMKEVEPNEVGLPSYLDIVKEIKELRDFVNNIKIDKHLMSMMEKNESNKGDDKEDKENELCKEEEESKENESKNDAKDDED